MFRTVVRKLQLGDPRVKLVSDWFKIDEDLIANMKRDSPEAFRFLVSTIDQIELRRAAAAKKNDDWFAQLKRKIRTRGKRLKKTPEELQKITL